MDWTAEKPGSYVAEVTASRRREGTDGVWARMW